MPLTQVNDQTTIKRVDIVLHNLMEYVEGQDYAGYDPYDALNSPVLQFISMGNKWTRIGFTQFLRRCPVNLRPILAIQKGHNPKAIGLFLGGYSKMYLMEHDDKYLGKIEYLLELLQNLKSDAYSGSCWGYNFDWQSRTFFRPKGTPTIVNTAFIGHALLDCYELTGIDSALKMAVPIKDFLMNDLHRTEIDDSFCFSYTPVDTAVVHNANMLGASILARLNKYCPDDDLVDTAMASLSYSMRHQHEDGSWYYADTDCQKWIDSFHTGFNLQALRYILAEGYAEEYQAAYEKGVTYYADNFFLEDGMPKYYNDKINPVDIHAPAEAVYFFSSMGGHYYELTDRILSWMLDNMLSSSGYFYFRKINKSVNKIPYMRWSQAWTFHALAEYMYQNSKDIFNVD